MYTCTLKAYRELHTAVRKDCPEHAISVEMSPHSSPLHCECGSGYYGRNGEECLPCPAGFKCPGKKFSISLPTTNHSDKYEISHIVSPQRWDGKREVYFRNICTSSVQRVHKLSTNFFLVSRRIRMPADALPSRLYSYSWC